MLRYLPVTALPALLLLACSRQAPPPATFSAPESFRSSLAKVFEAYLIVEKALADGQTVLAANAGAAMHEKLHEVSEDGLDSAAKAYWDTTTNRLMAVLHQPAATSGDVTALRKIFADYSPLLSDAFRKFTLETRIEILRFHCPKALDGKDAMWMQGDAAAANPYLGRADLSCAERSDPP